MNYEIVTDSSANLTDEIINEYGIHILSLMFRVGTKEFRSFVEGEKTDIQRFYGMMRAGEVITTSQIGLDECRQTFERILKQGKDVLYIGFSSALSGTYGAGAMTAAELSDAYPGQKIYTVDTLAASMGEGLLVYSAARMRKDGKTIEEVRDWLLENRLHLAHWFTVDDLQFLKRGGRISGGTALLGTILQIKPVMHVDDEGRLVPVGKVRGRRQSLEALVKRMEETAINPSEQTVFISHGDCIEDIRYMEKLIRERLHVKEIIVNYVDPVVGAHSGPGTVALFFFASKR